MKRMNFLGLMLICWAALFVSCSDEKTQAEDDKKQPEVPVTPPAPTQSFSLLSADGQVLEDGAEIRVTKSSADLSEESAGMKMIAWIQNNTDADLKLTVSYSLVDTNYADLLQIFRYCWTICYDPGNSPETSAERTFPAQELFKDFYGSIEPEDATPSFDAVIEYTVTNTENGDTQKVRGHYIYTKE